MIFRTAYLWSRNLRTLSLTKLSLTAILVVGLVAVVIIDLEPKLTRSRLPTYQGSGTKNETVNPAMQASQKAAAPTARATTGLQLNSRAASSHNNPSSLSTQNVAPSQSHTATRDGQDWLVNGQTYTRFNASDPSLVPWFFSSSHDWVINTNGISVGSANKVVDYGSYAQFANDVQNNAVGAGASWVQYDDEAWAATPTAEQQDPATYLRDFANLAHQHGYKVIETPARDLMSVAGAQCNESTAGTNSLDRAYLACGIAGDTRYADAMDIQAQSDQLNLSQYASFVSSAALQIHSANPSITIIAGLTTYRSYSASSVVNAWRATHTVVQGFWMNVEDSSSSALSNAVQALETIKASE